MHPSMSKQPIAKENLRMNAIKSMVSLLVAVSLMGFIMIAQHDYQLKFAPNAGTAVSSTATSGTETIALR
jgi:hypothetical protein